MKYYSEDLKKVFETVEDLEKAEAEAQKAKEEKEKKEKVRAERAKEVEDAYKKANDLLSEFCKDYGSFHCSIKTPNTKRLPGLFDMFDWLW